MEIATSTRRGFNININFYLQTLLWSLLSVATHGVGSDISCLRSIKDSLEDPFGHLSGWHFSNTTQGFICSFVGVECWHVGENRVLNIDLSNMGLKGHFPRGLQYCSSLTGLDISSNDLSGPIPSDVSTLLPFATFIHLSNNKFSGEIPADLSNCAYLNSLRLDHNMFSGQIPQQLGLLTRIRSVSFGNNRLSGPVPAFREGSFFVDSYANNMGLCGGPLVPCSLDRGNRTMGFLHNQSFKDGLVVGFVSAFASVVVYMSLCLTKNNHRNTAIELGKYICYIIVGKIRIMANQIHDLQSLQLQENRSKKIALLMERLTSTMKFEELNDATDCFSIDNAIGVGKMGILYKGTLDNGWNLAIKRVFDPQMFGRQVLLEITILGKLRHRNIVPLLGFCVEGNERILVYQYMSNGRLSKWLHPLESEVMRLTWPDRIKIALGVAKALSWLHHTCNLHIVHLNLSSECILLDKNFEPKLSNFGEAKFMSPNNNGDDLGMSFYVKDGKKDVYDFGSLLFEMITGKTYNELLCSPNIVSLFGEPSSFSDLIEGSLIGKGFENEIFSLIKVACECVQPFADQRPTMNQVYNNMSNIWEVRHGPNTGDSDASSISSQSEIIYPTGRIMDAHI